MAARLLAAGLALFCPVLSCIALAGAALAEPPLLAVGEAWPPYGMPDRNGLPAAGIEVDILEVVLADLGLQARVQFYPWQRAWVMATNGEADIVLAVSYKSEREPYIHYPPGFIDAVKADQRPANYVFDSEYVFFARKGDEGRLAVESLDQLRLAKSVIGIVNGYSYTAAFLKAGLTTEGATDAETNFRKLLAGRIDLFAMERTVGFAVAKPMGVTDRLVALPYIILRKPYATVFARRSPLPVIVDLPARYYAALEKRRADGTVAAIFARYSR